MPNISILPKCRETILFLISPPPPFQASPSLHYNKLPTGTGPLSHHLPSPPRLTRTIAQSYYTSPVTPKATPPNRILWTPPAGCPHSADAFEFPKHFKMVDMYSYMNKMINQSFSFFPIEIRMMGFNFLMDRLPNEALIHEPSLA